jgi:hypothetical protein
MREAAQGASAIGLQAGPAACRLAFLFFLLQAFLLPSLLFSSVLPILSQASEVQSHHRKVTRR